MSTGPKALERLHLKGYQAGWWIVFGLGITVCALCAVDPDAWNWYGSTLQVGRTVVRHRASRIVGGVPMGWSYRRAVVGRAGVEPSSVKASHSDMKSKALDAVLKEVNSRFGSGAVMRLGDVQQYAPSVISSGALTLDMALGGGWPQGRIVEIYGPESSGKTTVALHAMAEVQKTGGIAALIDAEHAFDADYASRLGVDVENLILCQPDSGEMALEVVDSLVRSGAVDLIAVDSVAALAPRAEIEGEIGTVTVGAQARLMSHALRKLTPVAAKSNCTILFLNQIRYKIGVLYGNPEVTSGGNALKFYASVRLEIRVKGKLESEGEQRGIHVKTKVVKNKCAPPYKIAEFDIIFGNGINALGCLVDVAEKVGVVERRGSWYYKDTDKLAQGRDNTLEVLRSNSSLALAIKEEVSKTLSELS